MMPIAVLREVVQEAANSLASSLQTYWPSNGNCEIAERNQTMHLASVFLRQGWSCWAESHAHDDTSQRYDLLAWNAASKTLCIIEAKRLFRESGLVEIMRDMSRIASFCAVAEGLVPDHCFGLITATTWSSRITHWWTSQTNDARHWPAGAAAWTAHQTPATQAAERGEWRALPLSPPSQHVANEHQLLYALWPLAER